MGVLSDWQLERDVKIEPFQKEQQSKGVISSGVSSYGYDARVGYKFKIFHNMHTTVVDPKNFDERTFENKDLTPHDHDCKEYKCIPPLNYVDIPHNSFALAESLETFTIPRDCLAICVGKSTYARCGIIVNVTPLEPCLSEDTEVLTPDGWKLMKDVNVGDNILTRHDSGRAEFQKVERKQVRDYHGNLLHFAGRSVDQAVTPDHKLFVHWPTGRPKNRRYHAGTVEARDVFGRHNYQFDRQVDWRGSPDPDTIEIGGMIYPAGDFLFFLGCWLGDGSAFKGTDGGYHVKLAVVTKERKREAFRNALATLKIKASERDRGFEFYSKSLSLWLQKLGHAKGKYIPRWALAFSPKLLQRLLDGLMESDGTKSIMSYTTASKQLADDVQELAFKCGKAAIVREVTEDSTFGEHTVYRVRICGTHLTPKMPPTNHHHLPYDGKVYDFTVPNHVFFCRRNGKASWTGNCWHGKVTIEISNTTPLPARIYAGEGIMQVIFLRTDGELEACVKTISAAYDWFHNDVGQKQRTDPDEVEALFRKLMSESACRTSYADRKGKYQDQQGLTLPFVKE